MHKIMLISMIFGKAFAFCIFILLIFSVQNSLAVEDDDEKPYFDFSVFQDKDKYENWKNDKIRVFEEDIEKIKQVDTEDEYVAWFDGYFPPCEMGDWKEFQIGYWESKISQIKALKFYPVRSNKNTIKDRNSKDFVEAYKNGNFPDDKIPQVDLTKSDDYNEEGFERDSRGKLKLNLPECLQGEYDYAKFNTLYDPRIHNVTNHSYKNSGYDSNITATVAPIAPVVEDKTLEIDVSEEQSELISTEDNVVNVKQEKSFLKRLIDKIKDYIWVES